MKLNAGVPCSVNSRRRGLLSRRAASRETEAIQKTLIDASPIERRPLLLGYVRKAVAELLGFAETELSDSRTGFFQMGMDSIMAVELQKRLEIDLRCTLTPTVAFEHPTIGTLTDHLEAVVFGKSETAREPSREHAAGTSPNAQERHRAALGRRTSGPLAKKLQPR